MQSCNVALMQIAETEGRKTFAKYQNVFCFGKTTHVDLYGEAAGLVYPEEKLNPEKARHYIAVSLRKEFASENGTELNSVLPKMSPLNPNYLTKKHTVFQKITALVEKFKGVSENV